MSDECKIIMTLLEDYIKLKDDYKEYNKENLYNVFTIFMDEVFELNDIICTIENKLDKMCSQGYPDDKIVKEIIEEEEENILNEIADVLLTGSRLIQEFGLKEALSEMIEYKYERQVGRELNRFKNVKNELLK